MKIASIHPSTLFSTITKKVYIVDPFFRKFGQKCRITRFSRAAHRRGTRSPLRAVTQAMQRTPGAQQLPPGPGMQARL
jgi:hypothetical protein